MQLHTLQRLHPLKKKSPRLGRGGKRGTTSGRGQKGQGAHAGRRIPTGMKEIMQRLPKLRGISNKSLGVKPRAVNIEELAQKATGKTIITKLWLMEHGFIKSDREAVKILGDGAIKIAITISGVPTSKSAKEKIEKAGGTVT